MHCRRKKKNNFFMYDLTQANEKYKGDARLQKCYTVDFQETQGERRGGAAVLCGGQP